MPRFPRYATLFLACVALARPAAAGEELLGLRAGRLVDVETGQVRRDQLLLVQGERVLRVEHPSATRPPPRPRPCRSRVLSSSIGGGGQWPPASRPRIRSGRSSRPCRARRAWPPEAPTTRFPQRDDLRAVAWAAVVQGRR